MTSWYSIQASIQNVGGGNTIVKYYFSVDTTSNLVTGFYSYHNIGLNTLFSVPPSPPNFTTNHKSATNPPYYSTADNIFDTTTLLFSINHGINYSDTYLQLQPIQYETTQTTPFTLNCPLFSFYSYDYGSGLQNYLWGFSGHDYYNNNVLTNSINIQPISGPPTFTCFKEDTKILTDKGYIPIQDLRKGDLVKTLMHGYKAIDMIGKREIFHPALQERIKDQLYKCSQSEYTEIFEPLIITGCHSILVDSFTDEEQKQKVIEVTGEIYVTDNKYRLPACADPRASIYETPGTYTIYHLALENDNYYMNYGIYANGLLVETCSKRYLKELSNMTLIK
jgi:hypothetical protein